jgi:hypothetical protein
MNTTTNPVEANTLPGITVYRVYEEDLRAKEELYERYDLRGEYLSKAKAEAHLKRIEDYWENIGIAYANSYISEKIIEDEGSPCCIEICDDKDMLIAAQYIYLNQIEYVLSNAISVSMNNGHTIHITPVNGGCCGAIMNVIEYIEKYEQQ